ncbi:MAG: hypothetical protein J0I43_12390 [Microbacterium sp.]|uniref:hypothetical protein n=1 Tax=Microbacterium sp. TaxID=51671 RepID=UPI001AC45930|nr:hypothetical protein [Microbacterium sp.]MBN9178149.1 hypothetical protein [Microbacterium sp.]
MTSTRTLVRTVPAAGALVLALALGGCAGASSAPATGSASAQLAAPVIADLTKIDGTTVTVPVGGVVDLVGDDETFTDWTADIDDPEVVSFTAGKKDASASFNPGLTALSVGDSDVTLTNGSTGQKVEFEVEVTAKG